jgi:protein-glutamine gamma-glutamyltransferase
MDNVRPQLEPHDLARLRWVGGTLLGVFASWTVFFLDIAAWGWWFAIQGAGALALLRPTWPARVPAWAHRLAFPVIASFFAYDLYASGEPLVTLIRLNLMLILYRLCMHRQRRDDLQIVVLGLFLIIVTGVLSVSLAFVLQIVGFTLLALVFLLIVTLSEAAGFPAANPDEAPTWARAGWHGLAGRVRATSDWRLWGLGGVLFGVLVGLAALLFLTIPRFEIHNSLFLDQWINRPVRSGFTEQVRFGEVTDITVDNSLAFVVDVADRELMPALPYWRMVVLDEYTREGFSMSSRLRTTLTPSDHTPRGRIPGTPRRGRPPVAWTIYFEPGISRYLPLLGDFYAINFSEPQAAALNETLQVLALKNDPARMLAYRVFAMNPGEVIPDAGLVLARRTGQPVPVDFLRLPEFTPAERGRLATFLQAIGTDGEATAFAEQTAAWLRERHAYSLTSALPPGEGDPLLRWLAAEGDGHCEFFAGAFVVLARAAGHPARLVTGFRGGTWNGYSDSFAVRNAHAHAWAEIFDDELGAWRRVDPTPGHGGIGAADVEAASGANWRRPPDTGWRARIESLRVFWYRRVINFDERSQAELMRAARTTLRELTGQSVTWVDDRLRRLKDWLTRPWDWRRAAHGLMMLGALAAMVWFIRGPGRTWWWRWRSRHATNAAADPVRRAAGRWLRRWSQAGSRGPCPPALRVDLERLRYGDHTTWPDPGQTLRSARRAWRRARRQRLAQFTPSN